MSAQARDPRLLALSVIAVAVLSWALLAWSATGSGPSGFDHHSLGVGGGHGPEFAPHDHAVGAAPHSHAGASASPEGLTPGALTAVVAGWAVMVVAMMLPPALPLLQLVRRLVAGRRHPGMLVALGASSFVAVWTVAGIVLVAGDAGLHELSERVRWLGEHPELVAGFVLIGAGSYQFSPLKDACLRACRTPRSFAVAHWRGRRPVEMEVVTVTGAYAASCVGCCWALMAVSFAVGAAAMPVMVILTLVMAAERLARWGRRLVRPVGIATTALGAVVALGLVPAGPLGA